MHINFVKLKETVESEQARSIEMQKKIFEMMKQVQTFAIEEAARSSRVLGGVSQQCAKFHNRCIPLYKQKDYEMGISAVQHRNKRNSLEKENNISRTKAEDIIKQDRLADLNIWEDCVPHRESTRKLSNRNCRVKTRQITKQLQEANQETEGAEFPLKVLKKVSDQPRDANAEVSRYDSVDMHFVVYHHVCCQEKQYLVDQAKKVKENGGILKVHAFVPCMLLHARYYDNYMHSHIRTHYLGIFQEILGAPQGARSAYRPTQQKVLRLD